MRYSNKTLYKTYRSENAYAMFSVTGLVSKGIRDELRRLSYEKRVPIQTLVARAVMREIMYEDAFELDLSLPADKFTDINEDTTNLFEFIKKYPGLSLEHLVVCREDYGVHTIDNVKKAYLFLVDMGQIVEHRPGKSKFAHHPESYKVVSIRRHTDRPLQKERKYKEVIGPLNDVAYEDIEQEQGEE